MIKLKNFKDVFEKIRPKKETAIEKYFDINYTISKFLVDFRVENKLTQKQLAKKLGVSQVMISKYENGDYNFSLKKICDIAEVLDAKLSFDIMLENSSKPSSLEWNIGENNLEEELICLTALKTA